MKGSDVLFELSTKPLKDLLKKWPFVQSFFDENHLNMAGKEDLSYPQFLQDISYEHREDQALDIEALKHGLQTYIEQMLDFLGDADDDKVTSITIVAGYDKTGKKEAFESITIKASEIVSVVGPTGSGKSRLLADIEWLANGDTPTKRTILINNKTPDRSWRFSTHNRMVAQLSQNMNFVMDLSVMEFLHMHAKCRMVTDTEQAIQRIMAAANDLAGEPFYPDTPITALSGGQSRALMIADTAILSSSPIVLIDEIENAGIDRKKAIQLLVSAEKIVLMATHDPSLALLANRRIVIQNGAIHKVMHTSPNEKKLLAELEGIDKKIQEMRTKIRAGEELD